MLPGVTGVVLIVLSNSNFINVGVVTVAHNIAAAQVAVVLVSLQTFPPRVGDVTEGISPAGRVAWVRLKFINKILSDDTILFAICQK